MFISTVVMQISIRSRNDAKTWTIMSKSLWRKSQDNKGAEDDTGLHASLVCYLGFDVYSLSSLSSGHPTEKSQLLSGGPSALSLSGVVVLCPGVLPYQFRVPLHSAYTLVNTGIARRCCRFRPDHLNKQITQ